MNRTQQALVLARATIAAPENWCQQAQARDRYGRYVGDPLSESAARWCVIGALRRVTGASTCPARELPGYGALQAAARDFHFSPFMSDVNDDLDHATVTEIYCRAFDIAAT